MPHDPDPGLTFYNDLCSREIAAFQKSRPEPCSPAFTAGQQAYRDGVVVGDNPHDCDTNEHWEWMCGWSDAGITARKAKLANNDLSGRR